MALPRPAGRPPFQGGKEIRVSIMHGLRSANDAGADRVVVDRSRISSRPKGLGGQPAGAGYNCYFSSVIRPLKLPCSVVKR